MEREVDAVHRSGHRARPAGETGGETYASRERDMQALDLKDGRLGHEEINAPFGMSKHAERRRSPAS